MNELFLPQFALYTYFAIFFLFIAVLEIVLYFFGPSIDSLLNVDLDINSDFDLNIFKIQGVPFLVLSFFFTLGFCSTGFLLNHLFDIHFIISVLISSIMGLSSLVILSKIWLKFIPEVQNFSIDNEDFIGKKGQKLEGVMTHERPVQVKMIDKFNKTHYITCLSAVKEKTFSQDEQEVLIVRYNKGFYYALSSGNNQ